MHFWETAWFMRFQTFVMILNSLTQIDFLVTSPDLAIFVFNGFFLIISLWLFCDGMLNFNGRVCSENRRPQE